MSSFSDRLTQIIKNSSTNIQRLSTKINVERPTFHKYISGDRVPTSSDFVDAFATEMMLSTHEKAELLEYYKIARMGVGNYTRRRTVHRILENAGHTEVIRQAPISNSYFHQIGSKSEASPLCGISNVRNVIRSVLEIESNSEDGGIFIFAQPNNEFIMELLHSLCFDTDVKIEHVFCLEKTVSNDNDNLYNLKCFQSLFPLLFYSDQYTPLYYYDTIANQLNIFQYLIITKEAGIGFSADCHAGILYQSQGLLNLLHDVYRSVKKFANPMIKPIVSTADHAKIYTDNFIKGNFLKHVLEPEPCLGMFFTDELIEKKILMDLPQRDIVINLSKELYLKQNWRFESKHPPTIYFSFAGLEDFCNSGRITEIPEYVYDPFTIEERIDLLTKLYDAAKTKEFCTMIANSQKFNLPNNVILSSYNNESVTLVLITPDKRPISLFLYENSISYALVDFMKYLESSDYILSVKETLNIIAKQIDKLKQTMGTNAMGTEVLARSAIGTEVLARRL